MTVNVKDARVCRELGGITMHNHCYLNNEDLEKADIDCVELGGLIHEVPYDKELDGYYTEIRTHKSAFLCEFPYSAMNKLPNDKILLLKKIMEA